MTRQSCVSCYQTGSVGDQKKQRIHLLSLVILFYSFCPLELSICINAVGNPMNERRKRWTMRICKINCVSCRHHLCIFNIFSLEQMCLASDKRKTIVDSNVDDGHCVLVISSGTMPTE